MTKSILSYFNLIAILSSSWLLSSTLEAKPQPRMTSRPAGSQLQSVEGFSYGGRISCETRYDFIPLSIPIPENESTEYRDLDMNSNGVVTAFARTEGSGSTSYSADFQWNSESGDFLNVTMNPNYGNFRPRLINDRNDLLGTVPGANAVQNTNGNLFVIDNSAIIPNGLWGGASAINRHGAITGTVTSQLYRREAYYSADYQNFQLIPTLGASYADPVALNDNGKVVGQLFTDGSAFSQGVFLYNSADETVISIPGLDGYENKTPIALNNRDQILFSLIDYQALQPSGVFLWTAGTFQPLDLYQVVRGALNNLGHVLGRDMTWQGNIGTSTAALIKNGQKIILHDHLTSEVDLTDFRITHGVKNTDSGRLLVQYSFQDGSDLIRRYAVLKPRCL